MTDNEPNAKQLLVRALWKFSATGSFGSLAEEFVKLVQEMYRYNKDSSDKFTQKSIEIEAQKMNRAFKEIEQLVDKADTLTGGSFNIADPITILADRITLDSEDAVNAAKALTTLVSNALETKLTDQNQRDIAAEARTNSSAIQDLLDASNGFLQQAERIHLAHHKSIVKEANEALVYAVLRPL